MNKKKGFILYFDILGYKNILKNNSEKENLRIADIICQFSDFYSKSNFALGFGSQFDKKKLFVRSFSDNFLFVYELERSDCCGLAILQLVATRIQYQFLTLGILTRGSISYGEIFEKEDIVFGVDLIHAVELEENHRMPSIVVDPILKDVFDGSGIEYKEEVESFDVWSNSSLDYQDSVYIEYTVIFQDYDGTVLSSKKYHYGDKVIAPATPVKETDNQYTYTFAGWDKEIADCISDETYTATYSSAEIEDSHDEMEGLSSGTIAGIVTGSVAAVGLGGFSLFWFVIKKKRLSDLFKGGKKK